jgi:hypothetical protein
MKDTNHNQVPAELKQVFEGLRQLPHEADPYLETRVLAQLRERRKQGSSLIWWKRLAIGTSSFSALAVALLVVWFVRGTTYEAFVDQPFVVRIELKDLNQDKIAKARIELPAGVHFDIEQYPELKDQKTLTLHWTKQDASSVFPFVLSATEAGVKTVKVKFFNDRDDVVAERVFNLKLKGSAPKLEEKV